MLAPAVDAGAAAPAFPCRRAANAAERLICNDEALAALDRKMAAVYTTAAKTPSHYADLNPEQRSWTRARNECWQASDFRACIEDLYVRRIAELQVRYRLVAHKGPFRYACDDVPPSELQSAFFETDPPSATLEYAGEFFVAYLKRSGGAARYETRSVTFREQNGEATVTWGTGAKEMHCTAEK